MKANRRMIIYISYILIGIVLWALYSAGIVDDYWTGMGTALVFVAILRIAREFRLYKDENYRRTVEIDAQDERNRFIRSRAWAWAGYLFILIAGAASIAFMIAGQEQLARAASWAVLLIVALYWGAYLILKKKY